MKICWNEISDHDRYDNQYYEQIDTWNEQHASIINHMSSNAQEDDEHHSMQVIEKNL